MTPGPGLLVRHASGRSWCTILDVRGGSIATHCRGRMAVSDTYELARDVPIERRCVACVDLIEAGLRELVEKTQ